MLQTYPPAAELWKLIQKQQAQFEQTFVTSPATINPGLEPLFNNTSCEACHPKDGRGVPPKEGGEFDSMFLRISVPGVNAENCNSPKPVPGFGTQLFQRATFGVQPQADVTVHYGGVRHSFPSAK